MLNWEMIEQAIESAGALIAFGALFLGAFLFLFVLGFLMFMAADAALNKLSRLSWNRVILSLERKALRSAGTK